MIRELNNKDILAINDIGKYIKKSFDIKKIYNEKVEKIYVYELKNEVVAFIHISNIYNDVDILNIAVKEEQRKKNIASNLVEYIIKNIKPNKIMLEVRESNINAIKLYEKFNFNIIYKREKYYGNESALIMELILK